MAGSSGYETQIVFPRPGKALKTALIIIFTVWLMFAIAVNWAGTSEAVFWLFCGSTGHILNGELWRLATAAFLHDPRGIGHVLVALIGLYFLSPSLEEHWGSARFARFLVFSTLFAYGLQSVLELLLPAKWSVVHEYWFGAIPAVDAVAIAWALSFKGRIVRLMFILPVSSRGLIMIVVALNIMTLIVRAPVPSGHIALFGGMLAGWLFGGGTPSPLRRFYLRWRLKQLDSEVRRSRSARRDRVEKSSLRVIRGGDGEGDSEKGSSGNGRGSGSGPGGGMLN